MEKIVIVSGIPTETSRLGGVLKGWEHLLRDEGHQVDWIHVRELPPEDLIRCRFDSESIRTANSKVEEADGLIVATPVYKASYTGILKTYLDLLPQKALVGKLVAPVAMGGTFGHLLMIDHSLKPVLSALGALHFSTSLYIIDSQVRWKDDGALEWDDEARHRFYETVKHFLREIGR